MRTDRADVAKFGGWKSLVSVARLFACQTLDYAGSRARRLLLARDASDGRQVEKTLHASETKFRRLLEANVVGVVFWSPEGAVVDTNDLFLRIIGYTREDLRRGLINWKSLTPPEYAHVDERAVRELVATGTCVPFEKEYTRKDGSRVSVLIGSAMVEGQKTVSSFVLDVTGRKRAETEWRPHHAQLRRPDPILNLHLQNSPLAMVEWDRDCRVIRWSDRAEKFFGWTEAEVWQKRMDDWRFVHEEDAGALRQAMTDLLSGAVPRNVSGHRNYTCSGSIIHCEWYNSAVVDDQGHLVSVLSLVHDVSERQRAEQELGELRGRLLRVQDEERRRIARELHDATAQNLAALSMNLALLEQAAPPDDARLGRMLLDCQQMAERSVQEIRTLSHLLHPPLLDELGLVRAMRDYVEGFSERSGISVKLEAPAVPGGLPKNIEIALFRVLQASLGNVHRHSGSPVARVHLRQDNHQVCLEIRDEGRGLPTQLVSAKGSLGRAAGVGLLGIRERAHQLGGHLELETGLPGTLVRVVLPTEEPAR
jgi:PAS domain S-box-containing protein